MPVMLDVLDVVADEKRVQARQFAAEWNNVLIGGELIGNAGIYRGGHSDDEDKVVLTLGWKANWNGGKYGNYMALEELPTTKTAQEKLVEILQINLDLSRDEVLVAI